MENTPINPEIVQSVIDKFNLPEFGKATIREVVAMTNEIEEKSGEKFIRMEMGVPGLSACKEGVDAQIEALKKGVASLYPPLDGEKETKKEASRFIKAFINTDVPAKCCVPVSGSMQGCMASFIVCSQRDIKKKKILFIDPGFPVQKSQLVMLQCPFDSFDVYKYRGEKLRDILEKYLSSGEYSALLYSNPNNPGWFCLNEDELKIIGELANKYDTIVIEDLAYFAMDFRKDLSKPFEPPFQSSVSAYTDNYILLISGSKAFSYAGERIGFAAISEKLYDREFDALKKQYGVSEFGNVYVNRVLYCLSSGTSHSAQIALGAMLKAANDKKIDFVEQVKEYGRRAKKVKKYFLNNGFYIVYDKDLDVEIADGFYFTVAFPGMTGGELMKELMFYGISAISLETTGSKQPGLRICTSFIKNDQYEIMEKRLNKFGENHKIK